MMCSLCILGTIIIYLLGVASGIILLSIARRGSSDG